jgi:hypothetical protein
LKCCKALLDRGLELRGCVKTATSGFPNQTLQSIPLERGEHVVMETSYNGRKIYAIGWRDSTLKNFNFLNWDYSPSGSFDKA